MSLLRNIFTKFVCVYNPIQAAKQRCYLCTTRVVLCDKEASQPSIVKPFRERADLPLITSRKVQFPNPYIEPKQAWLESMDSVNSEKLGIIDLHPDIFGAQPRMDILHENLNWQQQYRHVTWDRLPTRAERPGSGKKPFKQKGTGRHRAGSIRAPQWKNGGIAFGPRGPFSRFYMLSQSKREMGLRIALSVKYAQNDLHIVDSLDIPSDDPEYLQELIDTRYWGFSVLFADVSDTVPVNLALAAGDYGQFNVLPVYGLNVSSILKHETLVLTLAAVEKLEEKLLEQMHSPRQNIGHKVSPF